MKIKKNDKIKILSGKDKGREGTVERTYQKQGAVLVPGLNTFKKHMRKSEQMPKGGVVDVPRPIDVSKVSLICPKCKKTTKIKYSFEGKKKRRMCKKCKTLFN